MDELVKAVLDELQTRYVTSVIMNMFATVGSIVMLYVVLKSFNDYPKTVKALRITIVVIGLVVLVIMLQTIFDFSYAIETLKTVFETLTYETGQRSVTI